MNKKKHIKPVANPMLTKDPAKICLTVICKNESKVIERMLNSVLPILDYYVIVDTGSTDGTQEIIENFFKGKSVKGKLINHKWVNFQDARNRAITEAKQLFTEEGQLDNGYCFWIDCDEQLQIDPKFSVPAFKKNLSTVDGGNLMIHYGGQNYFRMQFYKANVNWYFYGPVHEVLVCDDETRVAAVEGLSVLVKPDGNSWTAETIQQKYEGHAKILEDYVANDPKKDPRWVFYLAQSYRDAAGEENLKKSLKWYSERIGMTNGYWEEVYFSALMVANLKSQLRYPEQEIIESFLKCGKYNIHRIEHLIPIMSYYQDKKEFDIAYVYGNRAVQCEGRIPLPHSTLFIDHAVYTWRVYDIHSLNCWYSGRREEGTKYFKRLWKAVEKGIVPVEHHERLRENKKFFIGK